MSLQYLIKIEDYRQYSTNVECILQFKSPTLLCNETKNGAISSTTFTKWHQH